MQYTEKELSRLIEDVEKEFTAHLAKAESDFLAKSEDGAKKSPFEKKPEEKKPEGEAKPAEGDKKPEGEAKPAEGDKKPGEAAAAPAEGAAPAAPAAAAAAPAQGAGHDYDQEDMDHMKKMYMSMSEHELKAHHDCIASLAKCGDVSQAGAAPAGALGQKSPDNNAQPAVQKSEVSDENPTLNSKPTDKGAPAEVKRENGGKIEAAAPHNALGAKSPASKVEGVQMEKSESEVALLKSEVEAQKVKAEGLQKSLDAVSAFLTKLVEKKVAPAGKAITSLEVIAKSEGGNDEGKTFTKSEIDATLSKRTLDPKLEKSDRDLINAYYLSGASINSISHLLK